MSIPGPRKKKKGQAGTDRPPIDFNNRQGVHMGDYEIKNIDRHRFLSPRGLSSSPRWYICATHAGVMVYNLPSSSSKLPVRYFILAAGNRWRRPLVLADAADADDGLAGMAEAFATTPELDPEHSEWTGLARTPTGQQYHYAQYPTRQKGKGGTESVASTLSNHLSRGETQSPDAQHRGVTFEAHQSCLSFSNLEAKTMAMQSWRAYLGVCTTLRTQPNLHHSVTKALGALGPTELTISAQPAGKRVNHDNQLHSIFDMVSSEINWPNILLLPEDMQNTHERACPEVKRPEECARQVETIQDKARWDSQHEMLNKSELQFPLSTASGLSAGKKKMKQPLRR
ncbi:hypothetical protein V8F20_009966 [Naviculisporaceae sp. PSN 640]